MHATKFVESYFDAWNHSDPEGVADHLTPDGIYLDVTQNVKRTHDELIVTLNDFFSNFPYRYELIGDTLTSENTVAFQYRVFSSAETEDDHSVPAYCGAEFMTLSGDAAMIINDYYDVPEKAQQHKYAKSGLRRQQMVEYKRRLEHIMVTDRAFLRPDLTLPILAQTIGCSVNHLSQVINAGFNMSFFDYLNSHRVNHAKELLAQTDAQTGAVLNVAFTVGFNTNSAFYAAFKKQVGMTPAKFRRSSA